MDARPCFLLTILLLLPVLPAGCKTESQLFCTSSQSCQAGLPVCDVEGTCTGIANTCMTEEEVCWDAGPLPSVDAGMAADALIEVDAAECASAADCDNGTYCDGAEVCSVDGRCELGPAPELDDFVACTVDSCDEGRRKVTHEPDDGACDNANLCDGVDSCDAELGCVASAAVQCPADSACVAYGCVANSGSCTANDRAYSVNYKTASSSGNLGMTCESSEVIGVFPSQSGVCDYTCQCLLNEAGELRVHCTGASSDPATVCAFIPGPRVSSGCSSKASFGGLECCFQ